MKLLRGQMNKEQTEAFKQQLQKSREITKELIKQRKITDEQLHERFTI